MPPTTKTDPLVPIEMVSKVLNHSHPAVTMRYIGTNKEVVQDSYDEYELQIGWGGYEYE